MGQQRLLCVHAIVRLREEYAVGAVGHVIRDFFAPVGGQTVHDKNVAIAGPVHQPLVDPGYRWGGLTLM